MYFDMFHKLLDYEALHPDHFTELTQADFEQILSTDYVLHSPPKKILFNTPSKQSDSFGDIITDQLHSKC